MQLQEDLLHRTHDDDLALSSIDHSLAFFVLLIESSSFGRNLSERTPDGPSLALPWSCKNRYAYSSQMH